MEKGHLQTGLQQNVKRVLALSILFMAVGTSLELYLLDHYEDGLQLIPIVCIGVATGFFVLLQFQRHQSLVNTFKIVLMLCALSGLVGAYLHLKANYEFEAEMKPTADAWLLFVESLSGALPSLAPGSMILFALIGYAYLITLNQKQ